MWSEAKPCPELIWFATNKCPLNCLYCCVGDDKNDDHDKNNKESFELSTLEAKELIRQAADFTQYLVIIGGEPLLKEINHHTGLNFYVYDPVYMRVFCQNANYGNIEAVKNFPLEKKLCGLGRYLNVDAFGNVLACLFTNLTVGNIKEKTLQEIWAEVISSPFFSYLHNPANLKGECGKCLYNRICGGCRTRAYYLTGDWLAPDPACYLSGT